MRHHLVQRIIRAYDEHKARVAEEQLELLDARGPVNGNGENADLRQNQALNGQAE